MKLSNEVLNVGLSLSMEFGENWLTDIDDRLKSKYSKLTKSELRYCIKVCRQINKDAHDYILKNTIKMGNEIYYINYSKFEGFIRTKYNWINHTNLNTLYSQSCYYGLK